MRVPRTPVLVGAVALTLAVGATPALAAEPRGEIRSAGGETAIANSYIVVLKDSAVSGAAVASTARDLVTRHGGSVGRTYSAALRGFEINADAESAAEIAANPGVAFVEQNHTMHITDTQLNPPSWGLDRIDQRTLPLDRSYTYPNAVSNVHAYVIDTGMRFTHNEFGGRAVSGFDAVDGGSADDCNGHGTHVAGTVGGSTFGVAKSVQLVGVRVLDCDGNGTLAAVIGGVDWVTSHAIKPAVANMSLSGAGNASIDLAVNNAINSGIAFAVAAGNGDIFNNPLDACGFSPARVPAAITVGATDIADFTASFSNYGTCVDLLGPGVDITSSWYSSNTAINIISGTSMATPHVTGVAAQLLSAHPTWTPQQVRDYIVNNSTSNVVKDGGPGTPNKLLYVNNTPPASFDLTVSPAAGSVTAGGSTTATVTITGAEDPQPVTLSAAGMPVGVSVAFDPPVVNNGELSTMTITTEAIAPNGTYPIRVIGETTDSAGEAIYSLTLSGGNCSGTNDTDIAIPDGGAAVTSNIVFANCGRNGISAATVKVNIPHTYRGDVVIDLLAPDGTAYRLKGSSIFDDADNIVATYTLNLSNEAANGAWKLQVRDLYPGDTGRINSWSLAL